jgi:hypothetical protein
VVGRSELVPETIDYATGAVRAQGTLLDGDVGLWRTYGRCVRPVKQTDFDRPKRAPGRL